MKLCLCAVSQIMKMSRHTKGLRGALGHGLFDLCVNPSLPWPTHSVNIALVVLAATSLSGVGRYVATGRTT